MGAGALGAACPTGALRQPADARARRLADGEGRTAARRMRWVRAASDAQRWVQGSRLGCTMWSTLNFVEQVHAERAADARRHRASVRPVGGRRVRTPPHPLTTVELCRTLSNSAPDKRLRNSR